MRDAAILRRMLSEPEGLTIAELLAGLAQGWGINARSAEYLPVGFGSYHWLVAGHFVTVDALEDEAAYTSLCRALETARALHLDFVVAPLPTTAGPVVWRLGPRYALSVYPVVEGDAGDFGPHRPDDLPEVLELLTALHRAPIPDCTERADLALPGRSALAGLDSPWTGGPYSERARHLLVEHADDLAALLAEYDALVEQVRPTGARWVVTHGEPHPGNFLRTPAGLVLVDWETARIAPPERDLWFVVETAGDPVALALYRLRWKLADIAAYAGEFRRPHEITDDITASWTYLQGYFPLRSPQ
ncbi:putative phosphotransferase [Actinoplanes friuliensis DSM 7358]|uniref:Putative phosphotransferase n=2 Tax=Actinoplanes friuliensis TaxID=196914 RepID=U5VNG4_9ACTN|nr:putative phosphotransferase [Actinoplanes friuliensis DSM 7358]